jgi:adenylate cyclase
MQMEDQLPRKLAAIFYADVADYSRLTGEDEEATHRRLSEYLDLVSNSIGHHKGKVVHYAGDAVLADFSTVTNALECASSIQGDLYSRNLEFPDDRKVQFRIGINLGEVIVDRDDIYGNGVNVAARLESLADAGGICISDAVRTAIGNKLPLEFEFMGEQAVKNIKEPIRAYQVMLLSGEQPEESVVELPELELPEEPSIAVLPFTNMSGDPEQEYFSDGITEDIITALSRISGLLVIARNSTMVYKGMAADVKKVGLEQGVRYVLEGSVRKAGNRIRVTAQLIDATTGHHQWAERYDREIDDIFTVQDDITHQITVAMQVEISVGEKAQMLACGTSNIGAWERLIRADDLQRSFVRANNIKARDLLEEAIELDPDFVSAWVELGWIHWADVYFGWSALSEQSAKLANEAADRALALEPEYPSAYSLLGVMALTTKDFERGIELCEKGVSLAPNNAEIVAELAFALIQAGLVEEAEQVIRRAIRLSPICPSYYLIVAGLCHLVKSDLESAVSTLRIAVEQLPDSIWPKVYLISTLVESGHLDEARKLVREVQSLHRDFSVNALYVIQFKDPEFRARIHDNLRKAGLSE